MLRSSSPRFWGNGLAQHPDHYTGVTSVAGMLGIGTAETLRTWIRRGEIDAGARPGMMSELAAENKQLRREVAELRRANEILKAASAFFAPMMII